MKKAFLALFLLLLMVVTAGAQESQRKMISVDWPTVKQFVADHPDSLRALTARFLAAEPGTTLTLEQRALAFYGQTYVAEGADWADLRTMRDSLYAGNLPAVGRMAQGLSGAANPIVGYFRLGMTAEEHYQQAARMKEATEVTSPESMLSSYLMDIGGLTFDVEVADAFHVADITEATCATYSAQTTPLYFTGQTYFLDGRLASLTVSTRSPASMGALLCYMPVSLLPRQKMPDNVKCYDVYDVDCHNRLLDEADKLVAYLSTKFGKTQREWMIPRLTPPSEEGMPQTLASDWYDRFCSGSVLPRAQWRQGDMMIMVGISSLATVQLSFYDATRLSHAMLDHHFHTEQPKAAVAW